MLDQFRLCPLGGFKKCLEDKVPAGIPVLNLEGGGEVSLRREIHQEGGLSCLG